MPQDGARLSCLQFNGRNLLTPRPSAFKPPSSDYGAYETRPVYGYDDCWPTVSPSVYPGINRIAPDHGELYRLPWSVDTANGGLCCETRSKVLPARITRALFPSQRTLTWQFAVENEGNLPIYFQHIMHPLMPLDEVECLALPVFEAAWDTRSNSPLPELTTPGQVIDYLLQRPPNTASMLLLRGLKENAFSLRFCKGPALRVRFPMDSFNTLGIWWNRDGYPDEHGCRRNECAFEPIPGPTSCLEDAVAQGTALVAPGRNKTAWTITWDILSLPEESA